MAPPPVGNALDAIGNTPCVQLQRVVPQGSARVFLKLESLNPTGSYKDRMARSLIEEAERKGTLRPGMTIVEATGGSTGSSLAFVCAIKGYSFHVVSSNAYAEDKLRTMAAFGADVDIVLSPSGKVTSDLVPAMIERGKVLAEKDSYYPTHQFDNRDVLPGYQTIGLELLDQFPDGIDAFCAAVGTAGMAMGVSKMLKGRWPETHVRILEPASAPVITKGKSGVHGVEGIGIGFVPPLLDKELYDDAHAIEEEEGRAMCRRLAREEGILAGTSTGLNVVAAIELAKQLGPGKTVVTVACDTGLKYMARDLFENK
ncbi:pyridoxal phosphate-dependent enzyme, beta subunit [Stemphylium lycopersici]|uniref:Pyridoxal phosphate-dependent enzyme, beta subunit n=1 Tax=Stemphylium lycopersici TaxID=183478 RepID=A0A364N1V2_STELY|nr:pyridoxal phosphate-dependent enzyme, beta subunit [Stemphylium lycopersici]